MASSSGNSACGEHPLSAFFELHIEQGPILEAENKDIGVVNGVQAMRWYEVTITGQDAHTGATPMPLRKNALLGAARMVDAIDAIGQRHLPGVATVEPFIPGKLCHQRGRASALPQRAPTR